jgi:UPF0755 protein
MILWIENLFLLSVMALLFYISLPVKSDKTIHIPPHSNSESIITQLALEGYNVGKIDAMILSKFPSLPSGDVRFKSPYLSRLDFLHQLTKARPPLLKLMLIPGETKEIFFQQVAQTLEVNQTKLLDAYTQLSSYPEAGIMADTYLAPKKMNERNLIKFLLRSSTRRYKKMAMKQFNDYNTTQWKEVLTVASIIQKEAANTKEMPLIASVIYNRLKKKMRLQMDGTLNYGIYSHVKVTPKRIKEDNSTFNTYKHKGLPSSPIGAVSRHAIEAALHPKKSDFLYFMRNKEGVHDFTSTFKKHRKNIEKVKKDRQPLPKK